MIKKELFLSTGESIKIYQDLFSWTDREYMMLFAKNSLYSFNGASSPNAGQECVLSSPFDNKDDDNFRLNKLISNINLFNNRIIDRSWINASIAGISYGAHSDYIVGCTEQANIDNPITVLYACNLHWNDSYGGETFFYNRIGQKEIVVDFIPGQLILFDSRIKHKANYVYFSTVPRYMYVCKYYQREGG